MEMPIFYVLCGSVANVTINNRVDYGPYMNQPPFTNHYLFATLSVVDSCFPFCVIYICKRDTGRALGLIVNKQPSRCAIQYFFRLALNLNRYL